MNLVDSGAFDAPEDQPDDTPDVLRGPDGHRLTDAELTAACDAMAAAALADLRASQAAAEDAYASLPWWRRFLYRYRTHRRWRRFLRDLRTSDHITNPQP